jgi:hypothetical protein
MNLVGRLYPFFLLGTSLLILGCNPPGPAPPPASQAREQTDHGDDHDADHDKMGEPGHHHHEHGDHDDEHHESYADAVAELDQLRGEVKDALAAGDLKKADGPVHEIGHILEELPELAAKETELATDDTIKPAVDDLFECFNDIDLKLHDDGAGKTYDEVADRIDAAIATLRSKAKTEEK